MMRPSIYEPSLAQDVRYLLLIDKSHDERIDAEIREAIEKATSVFRSAEGSNSIGFQREVAGAALRTQHDKNSDVLNFRDFSGYDLTGNHDNTAILQKAVNESATHGQYLNLPKGRIVVTAPINYPVGAAMGAAIPALSDAAAEFKTFIHIAHRQNGFVMTGNVGGRLIENIATLRDQPAIVPGQIWTPDLDLGWDFLSLSTHDTTLQGVLMCNPTKGFLGTSDGVNGAGRYNLINIGIHPMSIGVQIDCSYDSSHFERLRAWPYWSQAPEMQAWMKANSVLMYSKRNDNAYMESLFGIWCRHIVKIGTWSSTIPHAPGGTTYKLRVAGSDFDISRTAYYVEPGTEGHTVQFDPTTMQGLDESSSQPLILVRGNNAKIDFSSLSVVNAGGNAIRDEGNGNIISASKVSAENWNTSKQGFPLFETTNSTSRLSVNELILSGTSNGAPIVGTVGNYYLPAFLNYTPVVTAAIGSLTSYTVRRAEYRRMLDRCDISFEIEITDKGNASGGIIVSLPFPSSTARQAMSAGRELAKTGKGLTATIQPTSPSAEIMCVDNTSPAPSSGALICCTFSYRTA